MSKKYLPIPRIRGKAIQKGLGWGFEIYVTIGDDPNPIYLNSSDDMIYISEEEAKRCLRIAAQEIADVITKDVYKQKPEGYLDLIKNRKVSSIVEDNE